MRASRKRHLHLEKLRLLRLSGKFNVQREMRFCKCGCGFRKEVRPRDSWAYRHGHYWKGKTKENSVEVCNRAEKLKGKKKSEIHKQHLKEAKQKHYAELKKKGVKVHSWNRGIKLSKEHREAIKKGMDNESVKDKQRQSRRNFIEHILPTWTAEQRKIWANPLDKNPNWKGGKSFEPYPLGWTKTFKEQIRYRDAYKCQLCGCPEVENMRKLDVHHKDYDKKNIVPENLISLCKSCHMKTNFNREYWTGYFMGSLCLKY